MFALQEWYKKSEDNLIVLSRIYPCNKSNNSQMSSLFPYVMLTMHYDKEYVDNVYLLNR